MTEILFTIKDLALRLGVSKQTILNWEKRGFIKKPKRDKNNRRIYTQDDISEILSLVLKTNYFKNLKNWKNRYTTKNKNNK